MSRPPARQDSHSKSKPHPPMLSSIEVVQCNSSAELLEKTRSLVVRPPWGAPRKNRWAFRGQAKAEWHLVPSAFRRGQPLGCPGTQFHFVSTGECLDSYEQGQAEFYAVWEFMSLADQVGLLVPGDLQIFGQNAEWENVVGSTVGTGEWPPPSTFETLALAQHYGIPTRLLDFTYSAHKACWFAADKLASDTRNDVAEKQFAIWALDLDFLFAGAKAERGAPCIRVTVPRARNRYLRAQEGFFLLHTRVGNGVPAELDLVCDLLATQYRKIPVSAEWPGIEPGAKAGYKFVVSAEFAREVVQSLAVDGIDAAHLKPSFESVVTELQRRGQLG